MDNMKDMILEAVEMNGIENVVMPLMNEIFLIEEGHSSLVF